MKRYVCLFLMLTVSPMTESVAPWSTMAKVELTERADSSTSPFIKSSKSSQRLWLISTKFYTRVYTLTDFKNYFTDRLSRKFAIQRCVDIPPLPNVCCYAHLSVAPWSTMAKVELTERADSSTSPFIKSSKSSQRLWLISTKFYTRVSK